MTIEFKDESLINSWIEESDQLSAEAAKEMTETAQLVQDIQSESDGTLVDELITMSNAVLKVTKDLTGTMEEISTTIKNVAQKAADMVDKVGGFIKGVGSALGL